jgi:integrase
MRRSAAPKTKASRRKVFIDEVVFESLAQLQPVHFQPDDFVFHTERGTSMNPHNALSRGIHPACKRAGIPPVSWHVFRYTFSKWAAATGESIKAVQAQLGHNDPKMTLSVYTRPMPEAQRQVGSKVAGVLLPVAPKSAGYAQGEKELIQ